MAKTLISRLDAENIVRAAVDPETHEATGDVYDSVNDVSYPFGGGGGKSMPTCTVAIVSNEATPVYPASGILDFGWLLNEDGQSITEMFEIPAGESSYEFVYMLGEGEVFIATVGYSTSIYVITASNAVNCSFIDVVEGVGAVAVTDPTLDSSITLTIDGK